MLNNLPVHVNQCFSSVKTHEQTRTRLPTHYISTCCYFLQLWIRIIAYPKNTFTGFGDIKTKIKYVMEVFSFFKSFPFIVNSCTVDEISFRKGLLKKIIKIHENEKNLARWFMDILSVCEIETDRGFPTMLFLRWDKVNLRTQNKTK